MCTKQAHLQWERERQMLLWRWTLGEKIRGVPEGVPITGKEQGLWAHIPWKGQESVTWHIGQWSCQSHQRWNRWRGIFQMLMMLSTPFWLEGLVVCNHKPHSPPPSLWSLKHFDDNPIWVHIALNEGEAAKRTHAALGEVPDPVHASVNSSKVLVWVIWGLVWLWAGWMTLGKLLSLS